MRFGACTWIFGDEPLSVIAHRVAAIGLDGVELFGDVSLNPREARQILADQHLAVLSLTPENVDLCHPDTKTHRAALDYYLRLIDFAAEVGAPLIACHSLVGRVRAVSSYRAERDLMIAAVREIARRAAERNLRVAIELLNRYEAHLLNTTDDGVRFVGEVGTANVGLLLDAYHMNIEEANLPRALENAGSNLFLFHAADSNRQAVGRGHTDFRAIVNTLHAIKYRGDVVFECVAPGPDPFTAIQDADSRTQIEMFLRESLAQMK